VLGRCRDSTAASVTIALIRYCVDWSEQRSGLLEVFGVALPRG
jgi:hypothetical protein